MINLKFSAHNTGFFVSSYVEKLNVPFLPAKNSDISVM